MPPPTHAAGVFQFTGSAVASKLEAFTRLSKDDRAALAEVSRNTRVVDARRDIVTEGDKPRFVHLMLDGWACRYKTLPDGKRQIVSMFIPGDFCDLNVYILKQMDHSIGAITRTKVAMITPEEMNALTAERRGRHFSHKVSVSKEIMHTLLDNLQAKVKECGSRHR